MKTKIISILRLGTLLLPILLFQGCKKQNKTIQYTSPYLLRGPFFYSADKFAEDNIIWSNNAFTFITDTMLVNYNYENEIATIKNMGAYSKITQSSDGNYYALKLDANYSKLVKLNILGKPTDSFVLGAYKPYRNAQIAVLPDGKCFLLDENTTSGQYRIYKFSETLDSLTSVVLNFPNFFDVNDFFWYDSPYKLHVNDNTLNFFIKQIPQISVYQYDLNLNFIKSTDISKYLPLKYATYLQSKNGENRILSYNTNSGNLKIELATYNKNWVKDNAKTHVYYADSLKTDWSERGTHPWQPFSNLAESNGKFYVVAKSDLLEFNDKMEITGIYPVKDLKELYYSYEENFVLTLSTSLIKTPAGFTIVITGYGYNIRGLYFININEQGIVKN